MICACEVFAHYPSASPPHGLQMDIFYKQEKGSILWSNRGGTQSQVKRNEYLSCAQQSLLADNHESDCSWS